MRRSTWDTAVALWATLAVVFCLVYASRPVPPPAAWGASFATSGSMSADDADELYYEFWASGPDDEWLAQRAILGHEVAHVTQGPKVSR
jgi:hypothetical protein